MTYPEIAVSVENRQDTVQLVDDRRHVASVLPTRMNILLYQFAPFCRSCEVFHVRCGGAGGVSPAGIVTQDDPSFPSTIVPDECSLVGRRFLMPAESLMSPHGAPETVIMDTTSHL